MAVFGANSEPKACPLAYALSRSQTQRTQTESLRQLHIHTVVREEEKTLGLELNPTKCKPVLFGGSLQGRQASEDAAAIVYPGILFPSRSGLSSLGATLMGKGLEEAVRARTSPLPAGELSLPPEASLHFVVFSFLEGLMGTGRVRRGGAASLAEIFNAEMTSGPWRQASIPTRTRASGSTHFRRCRFGNLLDNNCLRFSIGVRLGAKLCRSRMCRCGAYVDEYGQHGLSCNFSGGRYSRQSVLNESLIRALTDTCHP
ncbi:hypothetical protein RvY_03037 [Ramazzottius varieornatus]|uniref:Uncharacterized protein n=1 Tax=Ramazzottius varieornatus TaxID=947166 RepID=A0A1D1UWW6_RAMVA|nr:hypothetical protein RvY_03037 [Ramazzottius varieornatus]